METPFMFLRFIGKSALAAVGAGALSELLLEVVPNVAKDVWEGWAKRRDEKRIRAEIQKMASASSAEVREAVGAVVKELAGDRPAAQQQALAGFLAQVPAQIRRTQRRPTDPSGATVPPGFRLRSAIDLLPLLPTRLPRYQPGAHPPGIGDWELVELLGAGGFGEVWKAVNPHMPGADPVALKFCIDTQAAQSLRHEASILGRVMSQGKHPGIVRLLHTYLNADPPCLQYEYVAGGGLDGLIQEWHGERGGPSPRQAARILLRLAETVGFMHKLEPPIVHRDLKPANILVQPRPEGRYQFKIADFGIGGLAARAVLDKAGELTARTGVLPTVARGSYTPLYASPQQVRGEAPDPRDDVHALGVLWYQLLTGELNSGVPGGLRWLDDLRQRGVSEAQVRLLASCIEARPEHRPTSAAVLAERLSASLDEEPAPAPKPPPVPPRPAMPVPPPPPPLRAVPVAESTEPCEPADVSPGPRVGRRRFLVAGAAVLGLSAVGIGGYALYDSSRKGRKDASPSDSSAMLDPIRTLPHQAAVTALAFTRDGRLARGTEKGWVLVHDGASGKKGFSREACKSAITGLAFSPDGAQMAVSDPLATLLCCPHTGVAQSGPLTNKHYEDLSISRDSRYLIGICKGEKQVKVWGLDKGNRAVNARFLADEVGSLVLSPGDKWVALLEPANVRFWPFPSLDRKKELLLKGEAGWFACLAFSPDDRRVACGGSGPGRRLRVWKLDAMKLEHTLDAGDDVAAVAFTRDGNHLVSVEAGGLVRWVDLATGKEKRRLALRTASARLATFSPGQRYLAAVDGKSTVKVWDLGKHDPGRAQH
jgi:serine/threonine protein kinase